MKVYIYIYIYLFRLLLQYDDYGKRPFVTIFLHNFRVSALSFLCRELLC